MDENQKKAKKLFDELHKRYETAPETLSESERRLMAKYQKEKGQMLQAMQDIQQLEQQINQARDQIQRLRLSVSASQGRASAFMELLMPEDLQDAIAGPIDDPAVPKGNGQDGEVKTAPPQTEAAETPAEDSPKENEEEKDTEAPAEPAA